MAAECMRNQELQDSKASSAIQFPFMLLEIMSHLYVKKLMSRDKGGLSLPDEILRIHKTQCSLPSSAHAVAGCFETCISEAPAGGIAMNDEAPGWSQW